MLLLFLHLISNEWLDNLAIGACYPLFDPSFLPSYLSGEIGTSSSEANLVQNNKKAKTTHCAWAHLSLYVLSVRSYRRWTFLAWENSHWETSPMERMWKLAAESLTLVLFIRVGITDSWNYFILGYGYKDVFFFLSKTIVLHFRVLTNV